jgi:hypothetical protein
MTTTIFLADAATLRISTPYSAESVAAIKTVGGATWDKAARVWLVPAAALDKVLRIFGDDCAVAPEVFMAASPTLPIEHFAETCAQAGVSLHIDGARVVGSGGCWTPILQAEINARAVQLRRLLQSGWQPKCPAPAPLAPEPASYDRITHMDRVLAAGERNARANVQRAEGYRADALRRRYQGKAEQARLFEVQP